MLAVVPACAARAWPPQIAFGQSETSTCGVYIDTRTLPDGTVEEGVCTDYQGTLGGEISKQGAGLVTGAFNAARSAAGAALGAPVGAPAAEPEPRP